MRKISRSAVLCIVICVLLSGCKPIPENPQTSVPRDWQPEAVDNLVVMEEIIIPSPAPVNPVITTAVPEPCNTIRFLRYRLRDVANGDPAAGNPPGRVVTPGTSPVDTVGTDAFLLLIPGELEGNACFRNIGRQLVYIAKTMRDTAVEVWAFDRRSNCLEDLTGLNAAEQLRDSKVAIDYYWNGVEIEGRKFTGYLNNDDLPFLSEFGLQLIAEDIYTILTTMVPDQSVRQRKVFVGGHSLGGPMTAVFAGWDFDGDPATLDDAGYRNCAGFVALDTMITAKGSGFNPFLALFPDGTFGPTDNLSAASYSKAVEKLRSGTLPRTLPLSSLGLCPETYTMLEIVGMRANWAPETESTVFSDIPYSKNINFLLRVLHSKNAMSFLVARPSILDTRYTNEALLGVIFDDNFMPIDFMQASLGFLSGKAAVSAKNFPLPGALNKFAGNNRLFIADDTGIPAGTGPLYQWANFDQIGESTDPNFTSLNGLLTYTTMEEEVSDIRDFSLMLFDGPSNLVDWYLPTRLMLDLKAAGSPGNADYGFNFLHGDAAADALPMIGFSRSHGAAVMRDIHDDDDFLILEGYNHFDPLTAAADRSARRANEVIDPLLDFILNPK